MKRLLVSSIIALTSLLVVANLFAQTGRYERKSISYLNALLLTNGSISLTNDELSHLLETTQTQLSLDRFDYNPLPDTLTATFVRRTRQESNLQLEKIQDLLVESIIPLIDTLLQQHLDQRAAALVSPEERASWAASKAKSLGVTSVQLEKVLNSAYLYFPVLTGIDHFVHGDQVIVEIHGTVLWYRVELSTGKAALRLISGLDKIQTSRGFGRKDKRLQYQGEMLKGEEYAFYAAADNFARNMEVAMRDLPDFKLAGVVREAGGEKISFDLGSKEGVHLDDRYFITEMVEDENGLREETVGLARVSHVGYSGSSERDEEAQDASKTTRRSTSYSEARRIIGGGFGEGMRVVEYPRLPLDIGIGLHSFQLTFGQTDPNYNHLINSPSEQQVNGVGLKLAALYNTARWSGIPQFFILLEGGYGIVDFDGTDFMGDAIPVATYQTISLGVVKRYYYRRISIPLKAEFGLQAIEAKGWWSAIHSTDDEELFRIRNSAIGLTIGTGVEWILTPSASLQLAVDYRLYSRSRHWDLVVNNDVAIPFTGPWIKASGLNIGLGVIYSPPRLDFDPMNLVKVALGI